MEFTAVAFTALCIFLAGRNHVLTWPTGIIACVNYGFVFYDAKLYADMILQVFFVVTGILGWMAWYETKNKPVLHIRRVDNTQMLVMGVISLVVVGVYSALLREFTDAAQPFWDSTVLVLSILGQLLLMRRYSSSWVIWIMVNTIAVPLFWSRELYMTAIMYGAFWIHAWYAWFSWEKMRKDQFKLNPV